MKGYLEWVVLYWQWERIKDENGLTIDLALDVQPISYHKCTDEDRLQFYDQQLEYAPGSEFNTNLLDDFFPYMNCFDEPEKLQLQGWIAENIPSHGKVFSISVTKCRDKDYCKTEEEINEFILNHQVYIQFN